MSTVIGHTVKHVLCLSLRLYRPCAGLFSSFTLIYGLAPKNDTTVHLDVSVQYYHDEPKRHMFCFKQQQRYERER